MVPVVNVLDLDSILYNYCNCGQGSLGLSEIIIYYKGQ